jgi:predicted O-linked N-acetylglucosamine transferase (SPINDLY family)
LQRLRACEVVLDPVHYCGGNTSLDVLAAGALLVTLPSGYNRGRHTYGFFRRMRFTETVAKTPGDYVDIAVRIATDGEHRALLKRRQSAAAEALYEDPSAVEQIAKFFEEAVTVVR